MPDMSIIIAVSIFLMIVIGAVLFLIISRRSQESKVIRQRIKESTITAGRVGTVDIKRKGRIFSRVSFFNNILSRIPILHRIDRDLQLTNSKFSLEIYIVISIALAFFCYFGILLIIPYGLIRYMLALVAAVLLGIVPFIIIYINARKTVQKFEKQLPDALDFLARSVKAGHSFSGALKLVGHEFNNPLGGEIAKTVEEINFGVTMKDALARLVERVPCDDLKFFALSVTLQLETGGNIAEILENSSYIIRERFKLYRQVKALSAEGKLSAIILTALPFCVALILLVINPGYLSKLWTDPIGKWFLAVAFIMIAIGNSWMRKIAAIRV